MFRSFVLHQRSSISCPDNSKLEVGLNTRSLCAALWRFTIPALSYNYTLHKLTMLFFISHHFRIICWSSVTSIIVTLQSSGVYCVTSASLSYATSLAMHPCLHERKFTSALYGWTVLFICFGYCLLTSLLGPKDRKCKWMIDWLIEVLLASGRKGTTSSDLRAINPDTQRTHIAHEVKSTWAEAHVPCICNC